MEEPLENQYFNWLCAKVLPNYGTSYFELMRILHNTPFTWFIPGDRNRAEDGCELRIHFLNQSHQEKDVQWYTQTCSVLEMFIAFAERVSFQTDIPVSEWFFEFLENLNLKEYRRVSKSDRTIIEDILNTFVWRTYSPSGDGGMFPLRRPMYDQKKGGNLVSIL